MNIFKNETVLYGTVFLVFLIFVYFAFRPEITAFSKRLFNKNGGGAGGDTGNDNTPLNDRILKMGDSGELVGMLQNRILKFNPNALPRYGADKIFGTETEDALVNMTGKKSISINQFDSLMSGQKPAFEFQNASNSAMFN